LEQVCVLLFTVYLMMLAVIQNTDCKMIRRSMKSEQVRVWKEAAMA
jgi:hypothetical protein